MEVGTRELIQFISLVATLAGAFAVVKSQLSRVIEDLKNIEAEMHTINDRLDTIESGSAVFQASGQRAGRHTITSQPRQAVTRNCRS
jgi:hypothetical protein